MPHELNQPDGIEDIASINEFAIAGEFGFYRVEGPFEVVKSGTIWGIVVPLDKLPNRFAEDALRRFEGEAAVLLADGSTAGGGVISAVESVEGHDEIHVLVDQYAQGEAESASDL